MLPSVTQSGEPERHHNPLTLYHTMKLPQSPSGGVLVYEHSPALAEAYLRMNGIIGAFTFRESARRWEVLEGKPEKQEGFFHAAYTTRREADAERDRINTFIATLDPESITSKHTRD